MCTISEVLKILQWCLVRERDSDERGAETAILILNWPLAIFTVEYTEKFESTSIYKDYSYNEAVNMEDQYEFDTKDHFLTNLKKSIRHFSLANFRVEIIAYETMNGPEEQQWILYYHSCESFREKVLQETQLTRLNILEINLEKYGAEIYLFALPLGSPKFKNTIVSFDSFNTSATRSFGNKIEMAGDAFEYIHFLGRIQNDNHMILNKCAISAIKRMKEHLDRPDDPYELTHRPYENRVVDLTGSAIDSELQEQDEDVFYELLTYDEDENSVPCDDELLQKNLEMAIPNHNYKEELTFYAEEDPIKINEEQVAIRSTERQMNERERLVSKHKGDQELHYMRRLTRGHTFLDPNNVITRRTKEEKHQNRGIKPTRQNLSLLEMQVESFKRTGKSTPCLDALSQHEASSSNRTSNLVEFKSPAKFNSLKPIKSRLFDNLQVNEWKSHPNSSRSRETRRRNTTPLEESGYYRSLLRSSKQSEDDASASDDRANGSCSKRESSRSNNKTPSRGSSKAPPSVVTNFIGPSSDVIDITKDDGNENDAGENLIFKNRKRKSSIVVSDFSATKKRR